MELVKHNDDWWLLRGKVDSDVVQFVRRSIPAIYRYFDSDRSAWVVHDKFIEEVKQLASGHSAQTTDDADPYAVLHLRPTAPPAIIKAVWREMAKIYHPDRGGDVEAFKRAKAAYDKIMR